MPKYPCVATMCDGCPFQAGGEGHGLDHRDFQPGGAIINQILAGVPFFCQETAIFDPRTTWRDGEPEMPDGQVQAHWRHCLGAKLFKQGKIDLPERDPRELEADEACPYCESEDVHPYEDGSSAFCADCDREWDRPSPEGGGE